MYLFKRYVVAVLLGVFLPVTAVHSQQGFDRSFTVGLNGGDFDTLAEALSSIDDSSASRQIQLNLASGIHVLGETTELGPFMHLVGAGVGVTIIAGSVNGDLIVVGDGGSRSSMRDLTVVNRENDNFTTTPLSAITVQNQARLELDNVDVVGQAVSGSVSVMVVEDLGVLTARDSSMRAVSVVGSPGTGTSVENIDARITLKDSRVVSSGFANANGITTGAIGNTSINEITDSLIAATGVDSSMGITFEGPGNGIFTLHGSKVIANTNGLGESIGVNLVVEGPLFSLGARNSFIFGETLGLEMAGFGNLSFSHSTLANDISTDGNGSLRCIFTDNGPPGDILRSNCFSSSRE